MTRPAALSPELRATIVADPWARALGIEFLALEPGYCRLAMAIEPRMVNFHGAPHGGVIFSLADTAFGAACNALGEPAVALSVTISYVSGARAGSRLTAEACQVKQGRRAGFYEVRVTGEDGAVVALVHCVSHRVSRAARGEANTPRD